MANRRTRSKKSTISEEKKKELAHEVHKYPALWNLAHDSYMKRDVAAACWDKIAEVLDLSGNGNMRTHLLLFI